MRNMVMSRVLLVLPLYHIYGYTTHISTALAGGCLIVMGGRFSLHSFLQAVQRHKVMGG